MFVNFSSSALSTHTVEGFENNRNICDKSMCFYLEIYIYIYNGNFLRFDDPFRTSKKGSEDVIPKI